MSSNIQIIDLTLENIADYGVCGYKNVKKHKELGPTLLGRQGDYLVSQDFMDFFGNIAGQTKGTSKVTPLSITPMGNEVVGIQVKDTMILNGQQVEINAFEVLRILDGRIIEAWDIPAVYTAEISDTSSTRIKYPHQKQNNEI